MTEEEGNGGKEETEERTKRGIRSSMGHECTKDLCIGTAIPGLPRSRSIFLVLFVEKKNALCRESRDIFRSVSVHYFDMPCSLLIYAGM